MAEGKSAYKQLILTNRQVCNNCFRRIRFFMYPTHVVPDCGRHAGKVVTLRRSVNEFLTGFEDYNLLETIDDSPGRACKCGAIGAFVNTREANDALTFEEFSSKISRLADRVEEESIEGTFDRSKFLSVAGSMKTDPSMANKDDEIFKKSLAQSSTI